MIFILLTEIHVVVMMLYYIVVEIETGKGNIQRRLDPLHISNQRKRI
jgi:hypothetical protein